jgi:hypothetical protein
MFLSIALKMGICRFFLAPVIARPTRYFGLEGSVLSPSEFAFNTLREVDAIDRALAKLEARHSQSQVLLLEEGVRVDTLRRGALV